MIRMKDVAEDTNFYKERVVVVWGCRKLGKRFLLISEKLNLDIKITAYCDNNSNLWGTLFCGIPIISPEELRKMHEKTEENKSKLIVQLAVAEDAQSAVEEQINALGIFNVVESPNKRFYFYFQIIEQFFCLYPHRRDEFSSYFLQENTGEEPFPLVYDENLIAITQPGKTGDYTIINTLKKNDVPFIFTRHMSSVLKGKKLKVITGFRDPISKDLSSLFEHIGQGVVSLNEHVTFAMFDAFLETRNAQELFHAMFESDQENNIEIYFNEFSKNVVNILDYPFNREEGYTIIKNENFDVFVYQIEKLNSIIPQLSKWVGFPFDTLENANVASTKWVASSYKKAQKEIKFSKEYFDRRYEDPFVRHVYSEQDIEIFKKKWKDNVI